MIAMPAARSMRHSRYQRLENRARVIFNGLASRAPPDYRHSPEWRPSGRSSGTQQQNQQSLLRMQAIFRLVPHHALQNNKKKKKKNNNTKNKKTKQKQNVGIC